MYKDYERKTYDAEDSREDIPTLVFPENETVNYDTYSCIAKWDYADERYKKICLGVSPTPNNFQFGQENETNPNSICLTAWQAFLNGADYYKNNKYIMVKKKKI